MSLENIPSAVFTAGSGGIVGFLIGFALKKVMKISLQNMIGSGYTIIILILLFLQ